MPSTPRTSGPRQQIEARKPAAMGPTRLAGALSRTVCLETDGAAGVLLELRRAVVAAGHVVVRSDSNVGALRVDAENDTAHRTLGKLSRLGSWLRMNGLCVVVHLGGAGETTPRHRQVELAKHL